MKASDMEMIRVWGRRSSSNVQKVLWVLEEMGVDHEQVDAGRSFGVVGTADYRALNPNGTVPTLQHGDIVLWESNAIVRYLAARYGAGGVWPEDAGRRALSDRWMDWTDTSLRPCLDPIFVKVMMRWKPVESPTEIDDAIAAAGRALAIRSKMLDGQSYAGGDQLGLGDIALGVMVNRWFKLPIDRPSFPTIEAYFERLSTRAPFRRVVIDAPPVV